MTVRRLAILAALGASFGIAHAAQPLSESHTPANAESLSTDVNKNGALPADGMVHYHPGWNQDQVNTSGTGVEYNLVAIPDTQPLSRGEVNAQTRDAMHNGTIPHGEESTPWQDRGGVQGTLSGTSADGM